MRLVIATLAVALTTGVAAAETVRIDTVQSSMPINYPVYTTVAQAPVVVQSPIVEQPIVPAPAVVPAPVVPAPIVAPVPMTYYYAPAPVYYPAVRARTIIRPWGARTVYRYW